MTQPLTPGRWRGLKMTSLDSSIFTILAFDQRGSFRRMLPSDTLYPDAVQVKVDVITGLAPHTSAVLLDPVYGLRPALAMTGHSGLLLSLEKTGYTGDPNERRLAFIDGWSVEKIKRLGASAVKLMVYYHPETGALAEELEATIHDVVVQCHQYDLPLFLEPMSYSIDPTFDKGTAEYAATRCAVVRETARRLSQTGADVLKLEFPLDAAFNTDLAAWRSACAAISEVCTIPWVLLSAGVDFVTFEQQTRIACEAGASGFLAGRAIWKECAGMSPADRAHFLATTAKDRTERLVAIAEQYAKPWTDFYTMPTGAETWFDDYAGMGG
ncbi:tagatose 1,6-diphosphate aldolase [Chloroflexota bacterium]